MMFGLPVAQVVLLGLAAFLGISMLPDLWAKAKPYWPKSKPAAPKHNDPLDYTLRDILCCIDTPEQFKVFDQVRDLAEEHAREHAE